ncbi:MAG: cytosine deaminase [Alicyclobacillus sp.]|nr:cytosine deaminase [Alicyclobacillus sp.]
MWDLLVKGVRMEGRAQRIDIGVREGRISAVAPAGVLEGAARSVLDGNGLLALPPYVEPHVHLDAALTAGQPRWNESGTLFEGIRRWSERKASLTVEDVKDRALAVLRWMLAQGILHVRTHVDVTDPSFTALRALLEVREQVRPLITLQIVAFPQEGILSFRNGQGRELLEEALRMGADVVGAIPHYEYTREYGVASVDACFELAQKYDLPIDVHCDEIDDEQSRFLEVVATRALETGMRERVAASHTTAMHSYNNAYAFKLFGLLEKSGIQFIANPLVNITLQGRNDLYPKRRGLTRIKELLAAGVNVCLGHDDVMDPWYSLGTCNMLQVAHMAIHAGHMMGRSEVVQGVDMVTWRSARALLLDDYGLEEGKQADFVLVDADDRWDLMRRMPPCRYVIRRGQVVAETPAAPARVWWEGREEVIDFRREPSHQGEP